MQYRYKGIIYDVPILYYIVYVYIDTGRTWIIIEL